MRNDQIKILGVNVSNLNFREVLESIEKYLNNFKFQISNFKLEGAKPLIIFTPNPEIAVYAQKDGEFKKIVNTAQINIPDGVGLILAGRILGQPLKERISGVELLEKLAELAAKKSLTIGLIGGKRGVALRALECLQKTYPGLKGWAEEGPLVEIRNSKLEIRNNYNFYNIYNKIQKTKTSFLFVGLGCPKQEYFIRQMTNDQLPITNYPLVLMAVGGSFDYLSGQVKRAPLFIRSMGFEWVFRLLRQPWRLRRQLALVKFVWLILKEKLDKLFPV